MAKRIVKSAEEKEKQAENQFEIDESVVDEVSNAEEFADVEISNQDVMDAVKVIDALADSVLEKADSEDKEIDADTLLDKVRDMIDDSHEETEEIEEEAVIPEEIESAAVRVMVSEKGAIELEQKPDEIYPSNIDGLECTMFDTCEDYPMDDLEETADTDKTEEDVLVIGNSASKNFKKGYAVIKSSSNKKAWNSAFKKVKEMVGSSKLTPAHWVIVSAIAKKEEEKDKLAKKIECALIRIIRNNKEIKMKIGEKINSRANVEGQKVPSPKEKPGTRNGFNEVKGKTATGEVTSKSGDPEEKSARQDKKEGEVVLPEKRIATVMASVDGENRKITLKEVRSSKLRNYKIYKVMNSRNVDCLDGKVIKSGKVAYAFKNTSLGMIACCAEYVENGKGKYGPVIQNNKVVITKGETAAIFQNYERIALAKAITSAKKEGFDEGFKKGKIASARRTPARRPIKSGCEEEEEYFSYGENGLEFLSKEEYRKKYGEDPDEGSKVTNAARRRPVRVNAARRALMDRRRKEIASRRNASAAPEKKPVRSAATRQVPVAKKPAVKSARISEERKQAIRSAIAERKAKLGEKRAIESKVQLQKMHEAEERQRLFQSSLTQMNEEKVALKSTATKNAESLNKLYNSMF